MIMYTPMTKKALMVCFEAHREQLDKCGIPYVFHPVHLAEQMNDEVSVTAALLHDVVEDTEYTLDDLRRMGFTDEVIEVVRLLTHEDNVSYMDYVRALKPNPIARKIKLADLAHNSDVTRFDYVDKRGLERLKQYSEAKEFLLAE